MKLHKTQLLIAIICCAIYGQAQTVDQQYIKELKEDVRGPYKGINWFCEDGSIREARDPCPEPMEGVQHATYKEKIISLAKNKHIFLDQILVGSDKEKFWDASNENSKLKQYQITNYLYESDNGWILQKAKNYRGAKQIEDEQEWGQEFLEWTTNSDQRVKENYLLLRLAAIDVPHGEDNRVSQRVRAYSKLLADEELTFMELRIKIHNNPSKADLPAVKNWISAQGEKLNAKEKEYADLLVENMEEMYKPFDIESIKKYSNYLPKGSDIKEALDTYTANNGDSPPHIRAMATCELLKQIREKLFNTRWMTARIKLIDLTNSLEKQLILDLNAYKVKSLSEIRDKICFMTEGLYGAGYIEQWEYDNIRNDMDWLHGSSVSLDHLESYKYATEKLVQWSSQMIMSLYAEPIAEFYKFEPLAYGFTDDKIRSSIILPLGQTVEQLNRLFNNTSGSSSVVMDDKGVTGIQGLNPGIAKGTLVVLTKAVEGMDLDADKIYAFDRPPADLKPVAGILNVKEGNPVSHVQLLARNLAIPNALISSETLDNLTKYDGKEVMYAVSPKGAVKLILASDMTNEEKKIFKKNGEDRKRITISMDKLKLHSDSLLDMSKIDASYSGKWCGPKAANLGQLKQLFPEHVVDGIVIPFGIFKDHMLQKIPGVGESYWNYLTRTFANEKESLAAGEDQKEIECTTMQELAILRGYIEEMPLKESLVNNLESKFKSILGNKLGDIPVFLRSDTNMEDLPQFTGAGLNLTLFNVLDRDKILKGIKQVWASPYTERSYQWRQQYLDNPEEVYPSILIIPSVNVDRSGVIITKGVSRGSEGDMSISFSRGVGGAVEGQSAESYVIYKQGYRELISPGRETKYRVIPASGGSTFETTSFYEPVLSSRNLTDLQEMATQISNKMDEATGGHGPYDIELGIKDDYIWLFQVRPFVENREATGSNYLQSLDPVYTDKYVILDQ